MKKIFNKTNFSIIAPLLCIGAVSTVLTTTSCSNAYISLETDDSFDASEINTSEGGCLYEITNGWKDTWTHIEFYTYELQLKTIGDITMAKTFSNISARIWTTSSSEEDDEPCFLAIKNNHFGEVNVDPGTYTLKGRAMDQIQYDDMNSHKYERKYQIKGDFIELKIVLI